MSAAELWDRLQAEGLVTGERPEPDRSASPWFVRVMLGIAGWIGAIFLLLFVGAAFAFVMDNGAAALVVGAACCGAAFLLLRAFEDQDFVEQFGLAISLAGQVMMIIGLADFLEPDGAALYLAVAATQIALALIVPQFLHRVLTSAGAAIALSLAIDQLSLHGFAAPFLCAGLAFVWLEPKRWAVDGQLWRPIGYGLVVALLLVETFRLLGGREWFGPSGDAPTWIALNGPLIGRGLTALVLLWAAIDLVRRADIAPQSREGLAAAAAAILLGLVSLAMPGLASALLILLLGFAAGTRLLIALGVLSLLGFVAHFYYSLHLTLLEKSGLLAVTGLVLLAACWMLRRGTPAQAKEAADAA
ncbi:DUF4401 domain-containing protein [Sphingosinicella terrae]|uniref:DUF4401 domain-containing protein n=1 Tax=Sphingosinicella terrae TaxID=2172047 RepID=UPI0013B406F9|nr:DUF4401 domain-containing protein [Sphingosinicella terrae]